MLTKVVSLRNKDRFYEVSNVKFSVFVSFFLWPPFANHYLRNTSVHIRQKYFTCASYERNEEMFKMHWLPPEASDKKSLQ